MSAFFEDLFASSGLLAGTSPTTNPFAPLAGHTWADSYGTAVGVSGGVAWASSYTSGDQAEAEVAGTATPGVGYTSFTVEFDYFAGADEITSQAFDLRLEVGGKILHFTLYLNSGVWNASIDVGAGTPPDTDVGLTASTTYPIVISVADGAQSMTINGYTVNSTAAWTAPTTGLSGIRFSLGVDSGLYGLTFLSLDTSINAPMGSLAAYSGATATLSAPVAALVAVSIAKANSALTAPSPTVSAFGGATSTLAAPGPTLYATAHDSSGEKAAILTAPSPTLSAWAGANATLSAPTPALTATGTVTIWGTAELSAPACTIDATGSVSDMAQAGLIAPRPNLIGYSGAVCSVTLTGHPTVVSTATTGSIGGAAITCPLYELTASATAQNRGSAELLAPSPHMGQSAQAYLIAPMATLTAIGHAVVTATYEAYAVNLNHQPKPGKEPIDEVTRYTNFPFTHIVRYQNSYFGVNSTGLYLLDGTTDYASPTPTPIPWAFKTAMTDFKSPQHKTVASAYFGGRLGAAATVSLHVGEDGPQTYSYATVRTDHAQNYRQVFGKGTKARYYALGASGTGTMELDDIDLDVHNLTRRI